MEAREIHHVGLAVVDLDEAIRTYEALFGARLEHREELVGQGAEAASVLVGGSRIELVAATGPRSEERRVGKECRL